MARVRLAFTVESEHPVLQARLLQDAAEMLWEIAKKNPEFKDPHVVVRQNGLTLIEKGASPERT